jgi:hypothetical protein
MSWKIIPKDIGTFEGLEEGGGSGRNYFGGLVKNGSFLTTQFLRQKNIFEN